MTNKTLLSMTIFGLIALFALPFSAHAASAGLAGSWQFTLTPTTPTPPVVQIPGLATFTTDGSMIETDGLEIATKPPSTVSTTFNSPGHGIWQLGPSMTFYYVQYFSIVANKNGSLNATNNTTMTLTTDSTGTKFTGTYVTELVNPAGMILKTTTGTVTGSLIPHPALP
jgi:hypothetical protein